jgi:flagellar M-ring protein FliF
MKLTPDQVGRQIAEAWRKQSKKIKIRIFLIAAAFIVLSAIGAALFNGSGHVVLYSGLSSSEAGEIAARLGEMGVDLKMKADGTILVPKEKEAQLKMTLASEGYPQSTLNYDIFSNNSGFMTTDYEKKKYMLFQLQNRLQDAIKTIGAVESAIVTISLPEEDSFVLKEDRVPATASAVLELKPIRSLPSGRSGGSKRWWPKACPALRGERGHRG